MRITCLNYTPFATTWPCLCTCGTVQNQSRAHARNLWAAPGWIHKTSDRTHLSECSTITYFAGTVIIINQGVRCKHDWVLYYLFPLVSYIDDCMLDDTKLAYSRIRAVPQRQHREELSLLYLSRKHALFASSPCPARSR